MPAKILHSQQDKKFSFSITAATTLVDQDRAGHITHVTDLIARACCPPRPVTRLVEFIGNAVLACHVQKFPVAQNNCDRILVSKQLSGFAGLQFETVGAEPGVPDKNRLTIGF